MEGELASVGTAVVLFPYNAQDECCVSVQEGEQVDLLEAKDAWWKVRSVANGEGWVPSSFLDLNLVGKAASAAVRSSASLPPPLVHRSHSFQVRAVVERLSQPAQHATVLVENLPEEPSVPSPCPAGELLVPGALPPGESDVPALRPRGEDGAVPPRVERLQFPVPASSSKSLDRPQTARAHEAVQADPALTWRLRCQYMLERDGKTALFFACYVVANAVYFAITFDAYEHRASFDVLGYGLVLARGSGALLKMNCAFVFLPVCRNLVTWAHGVPFLDKMVSLDSNIKLHKFIAYWIYVLSVVHCFAHVINFNTLSTISRERFDQYFAGITKYASLYEWTFLTLPGITGILLWLCQMLMYSSAMRNTRRLSFEVFWYTHHLFVAFTLLILLHGAAALFEPPGFWKWLIGPALLYLRERVNKLIRGTRKTVLHHVTGENSNVLAVYMERSYDFRFKAGQYLFLNCPQISTLQWHPFTITSSPEEKFLSVHMKAAGNWTKEFSKLFNPNRELGDIPVLKAKDERGRPILRVDGPYGTPSEHVFDSRIAVLIGAGIGVAPYASILKSIFYKLLLAQSAPKQYHLELMRLEKVHFYWICRDHTAFEWFAFLLRDLEERAGGMLEVRKYLTAHLKPKDAKKFVDPASREGAIAGLQSRTYFGRPDFERIFTDMADVYPNEKVGVFFCGPKVMSRVVRKAARTASTTVHATQFVFRKENF